MAPAAVVGRYLPLIQQRIAQNLRRDGELGGFYGMMAYHFGFVDRQMIPREARKGKSLRPTLCLLIAEALGGDPNACIPLAAGIEVLHNFSLIHDDIEDRGTTRHGRPTLWTIWGEPQAINAGDGMFALAHRLWLSTSLAESDPRAFAAVVRSLEEAVITLCEGQFLDIDSEGKLDISQHRYLALIGAKTASLIGEAAWVGARTATDDPSVLGAARRFGTELGLAFQIRDDLLGIWGDEAETGKSASTDISTRKMTLPVILALEDGPAGIRSALRERYATAPRRPHDEAETRQLLADAGAQERASAIEQQHWRAAAEALDQLPLADGWRETLHAFARSFVARRA